MPWDSLTPAEQQVLKPLQSKWDRLPADRQQRLQRGAEHWAAMTPQQRHRYLRNLNGGQH